MTRLRKDLKGRARRAYYRTIKCLHAGSIINPLRERVSDVSILQNLAAVGEKGGTWITFDEAGDMHEGKARELSVPEELKERVRKLIAEKYSDSMFFDETKETMLSTEMIDGHDLLITQKDK